MPCSESRSSGTKRVDAVNDAANRRTHMCVAKEGDEQHSVGTLKECSRREED